MSRSIAGLESDSHSPIVVELGDDQGHVEGDVAAGNSVNMLPLPSPIELGSLVFSPITVPFEEEIHEVVGDAVAGNAEADDLSAGSHEEVVEAEEDGIEAEEENIEVVLGFVPGTVITGPITAQPLVATLHHWMA